MSSPKQTPIGSDRANDSGSAVFARPTEGNAINRYVDIDLSGFGDTEIRPEDVRTPRIVLLNGMSEPVSEGLGKPGHFFNLGTGRSLGDYFQFVPLGFFAGRLYFKDRELVCRSQDRVHGDPGGIDANGSPTTSCTACIYSRWDRRVPPACDVAYNYPVLLIEKEGGQPQLAFLSFRGTANDAARQLNGDKVADGKPWYYHIYEAAPQQRHNEKGVWWVTKVRRLRETTPDERQAAQEAATNLAQQRIEISEVAGGADEKIPV